jgi:phosphoribosylamine--glycine ligase
LRLLVVGGGGREHALAWQLARSGHRVFCAPGNAGIARVARCEKTAAGDIAGLADLCRRERIDLTIVGPEAPLVAGIVDDFRRRGLAAFGPGAAGAQLEGDKAFAKRLMREAGIPTAGFEVFDDLARARDYVAARRLPIVIKAAGLAAGKGVVICRTRAEADQALGEMLVAGRFGAAGSTVVVEDCLEGEEASLIGLCDGKRVELLPSAQDHKRLLDGDLGPNTGGMGAYAPAPVMTPELTAEVERKVFAPLLKTLRSRGIDYRGVVYAGIMLTPSGPSVLEFNCRFGDPETQALLPLLDSDLAEHAQDCVDGRLGRHPVKMSGRHALCVVAAARGYPESYAKGLPISGNLEGGEDVVVFHAGTQQVAIDDWPTARGRNGGGAPVVTSGGRVLGVTGIGDTLARARAQAYAAIERISFDGMIYRKDIGARGLARTSGQ